MPHRDSTFLHTDPLSTLGFWIPLEDCTTKNGCLHAIPGSHRQPLHRRMVRAPGGGITFTSEEPAYNSADFVPLEIPTGSLVLLHGSLVHKSDENKSAMSRHAYTWHVIDGTAHYDALNWLQPSSTLPFPPL